jgi:hypothetical protein
MEHRAGAALTGEDGTNTGMAFGKRWGVKQINGGWFYSRER